jgi:hypothetical protein
MKTVIAILSLVMLASMASAQSPDPSKWMCRNLADSGGFTYQGETVFGTLACRPIQQAAPAPSATAPVPRQDSGTGTLVAASSNSATTTEAASAPLPAPTVIASNPTPAPVAERQMPRVFLQSESHGNNWNARRDQSMEMSKDFLKVCPGVRMTINQQMADYTVALNHIEAGFRRDNQIQVYEKDGDLLKKQRRWKHQGRREGCVRPDSCGLGKTVGSGQPGLY